MDDLWVFAYGSLMWRPGFEAVEARRARLSGYRRALCVISHVHRGTRERPGLVLGLDRGGACVGRALRVAEADADATLAYLRGRELVTNVYIERRVPVQLEDGSRIIAVAYVVDRRHEQYAGPLHAEDAAALVRSAATGVSGINADYVRATVEHLRELGIRDHWLEHVDAMVNG